MASRASLNKVLLIGNLTRDPELRYTPSGAAVCTFTVATNRAYVSSDGTKKEESEFTRVVAWNKLAELCSQLLTKGRKVYVEGRLSTRSWETPDGQTKYMTEVVIDDMRILDSRRDWAEGGEAEFSASPEEVQGAEPVVNRYSTEGKMEDVHKGIKDSEDIEGTKSTKSTTGMKGTKGKKDSEGSEGTKDDADLSDLPF